MPVGAKNRTCKLPMYLGGPAAPVTFPKLLLFRSTVGEFRFVWLNPLKESTRSLAVRRSVILKLFASERSVRENPGARQVFRPRLPSLPSAGARKSATLNIPL